MFAKMNNSVHIQNSVRRLSSSAVNRAAMVKPSVPVFGIEGRYATALYSAASKDKKLDAVEKELTTLKGFLNQDKKFAEFILNPLMKSADKKVALGKVLAKKNFGPLTVNLLGIMADNGRLRNLHAVIDCFTGVMSNERGEVICKIITAKPLDALQMKEFEDTLKGFVKKNEKILLQTEIDPSIIGGAVVSIGDKYIDMSFASKIKTYSNLLKQSY